MKKIVISILLLLLVVNLIPAQAAPPPVETSPITSLLPANSQNAEPVQHDLASGPFTVPTDRYLIIRYVSGHFQMRAGYEILSFQIGTGLAENRMKNTFVPVYVGQHNLIDRFAFSEQTYIYSPPDSEVSYGWSTSNPSLDVNCLVISGDLIPIP